MIMSERDEVYLRQVKSTWQSRQDFAGAMTFVLGGLTLGSFLLFLYAPAHHTAGLMVTLLGLLVVACVRLVSAAAKVVEINRLLKPVRVHAEIIEAEIIDERRHRQF